MDICQDVSASGDLPMEYPPVTVPTDKSSKLDEFFPFQNTEPDVSLEWLSLFLEDCFSSNGCHLSQGMSVPKQPLSTHFQSPTDPPRPHHRTPLQDLIVPAKPRSKRRRATPSSPSSSSSSITTTTAANATSGTSTTASVATHLRVGGSYGPDPEAALVHQPLWLAESELLVVPKKAERDKVEPRRCSHCMAWRTPQWRAGPLGPKTLCNACGVRYKSGRLLPEYRPAKSPTFVSYLHSNSHKKVMQMRTADENGFVKFAP